MATKRQQLFFIFFLCRATFFGIGFSRIFDKSFQDCWVSGILGMLLGIGISFLISKFMNLKKGKDLNEFLKEYGFMGVIIRMLLLGFFGYLVLEGVTTLINFKTSFFLLNTPNYFICLPALTIIYYIISKGLKTILRGNEIIFYLSSMIVVISILVLLTYGNFDNFLPILTNSSKSIFLSSLFFAFYSSAPLLLLTNLKNDGSGIIKMYMFTSFVLIMLMICIMAIFGPSLTNIYRFPEYIVLKRIKIFSFIEKIESIISIVYLFDNYALITLSCYDFKSLIPKKYANICLVALMLFAFLFTSFYISNNYYIILKNYYVTFYVYIGSVFVLIILILLALKKKPRLQIQREI